MSFEKTFRSKKAQAVVEYIVIFVVLTFAILLAFGGLNLGDSRGNNSKVNMKSTFDTVVDNAVAQIKD
ncbi:MAG: hypothetical protein WDL87_07890 [Candidatus Omnitrophota bacterium]